MINKRLIGMVSESRPRIAASVGLQWAALLGNLASDGADRLFHRPSGSGGRFARGRLLAGAGRGGGGADGLH